MRPHVIQRLDQRKKRVRRQGFVGTTKGLTTQSQDWQQHQKRKAHGKKRTDRGTPLQKLTLARGIVDTILKTASGKPSQKFMIIVSIAGLDHTDKTNAARTPRSALRRRIHTHSLTPNDCKTSLRACLQTTSGLQ